VGAGILIIFFLIIFLIIFSRLPLRHGAPIGRVEHAVPGAIRNTAGP
jgi:hypothetical protein